MVSSLTRLLVIVCLLLLEHSTHASPRIIFAHSGEMRASDIARSAIFPPFSAHSALYSRTFFARSPIFPLFILMIFPPPIALGLLGHFRIDHTTFSKWTHQSKLARKQIPLESCLQPPVRHHCLWLQDIFSIIYLT